MTPDEVRAIVREEISRGRDGCEPSLSGDEKGEAGSPSPSGSVRGAKQAATGGSSGMEPAELVQGARHAATPESAPASPALPPLPEWPKAWPSIMDYDGDPCRTLALVATRAEVWRDAALARIASDAARIAELERLRDRLTDMNSEQDEKIAKLEADMRYFDEVVWPRAVRAADRSAERAERIAELERLRDRLTEIAKHAALFIGNERHPSADALCKKGIALAAETKRQVGDEPDAHARQIYDYISEVEMFCTSPLFAPKRTLTREQIEKAIAEGYCAWNNHFAHAGKLRCDQITPSFVRDVATSVLAALSSIGIEVEA